MQPLGWSKGIGVPARLVFDMLPRDDGGFLIDNMIATGDGFCLMRSYISGCVNPGSSFSLWPYLR